MGFWTLPKLGWRESSGLQMQSKRHRITWLALWENALPALRKQATQRAEFDKLGAQGDAVEEAVENGGVTKCCARIRLARFSLPPPLGNEIFI